MRSDRGACPCPRTPPSPRPPAPTDPTRCPTPNPQLLAGETAQTVGSVPDPTPRYSFPASWLPSPSFVAHLLPPSLPPSSLPHSFLAPALRSPSFLAPFFLSTCSLDPFSLLPRPLAPSLSPSFLAHLRPLGRSIAGGLLDFRQMARSRAAGLLSRPMRPMAQALSGGQRRALRIIFHWCLPPVGPAAAVARPRQAALARH